MHIETATTRAARLRGLTGRAALGDGEGLRIPRCRSVHTFGMRFALDLVWLDVAGGVVRVDRGVPPWRVRSCRAAAAVLELASAGEGEQSDEEHDEGQRAEQRPGREREGGGDAERDD